ncbi:hypothetical protein LBMAG42_19320 [Deltaproteobacteria bacterium]|nr:hypothetical protein LBMAG42_19320 [Deltaproteobacteria bacterium]
MRWLVFVLVGCDDTTTTSWEQYNAEGDSVTVAVGAAELSAAVSTTLHSSTGEVEIGTASVDPGGGPIGTTHTVLVSVTDTYAADVDRVSVRTTSEGRGEDEYDLDADSTGTGIFKKELVTHGSETETREDTLTFRLWTAVESDSAD